ncbi:MAG: M23 family metallopeptidase, partial [Nitrospinales bacterium]
VKKGQQVALSGNTGRSFAPHLHYEIQKRNNKRAIYNPFKFKHHKSYNPVIPEAMKKKYRETVNRYEKFLHQA